MKEGWIAAACVAFFAVVMTVSFIHESGQHRRYRELVEVCASTADDQREFRLCVAAARGAR